MKSKSLEGLSIFELSAMYEEAASAQGKASDNGDYRTANKHYDAIVLLRKELMRRGGEGRAVFLTLMKSHSPWVRLRAAVCALGSAPTQAEVVLQELASLSGFCGHEAEMMVRKWRAGDLKFEV